MTQPPDSMPGVAADSGLARCYRHPMRETGVRCIRCNRPICPDCMRPASVGFHCPDDVDMAARTVRRPRTVAGAPAGITRTYVTWALIAINVVVYVIVAAGSHRGLNNPTSSKRFGQWDLIPFQVAHAHEFVRLGTSAFLHFNLVHLAVNMIALAFIGPFLERELGWWRFLGLYLLSALGGSVLVYAIGSHLNYVAGASGAIYGLFAAAVVLARRMNLDLRALAGTIALNFLLTFSLPGISVEGHVGGFIVGGLAALCVIGWPTRRTRVDPRLQLAGLLVLAAILVLLIIVRTATFPLPQTS